MFFTKCCARSFSTLKDLIKKKDWSRAYTQIEKQPSKFEEPELINSLVWGLSNSGRIKEAYKLIQIMPSLGSEPSEIEYTAAIEAFVKHNNAELAMNLLYQSQIFGIQLDAALYNDVIQTFYKKIGIKNVKWVLNCMLKEDYVPSIMTCVTLMKIGHVMKDEQFVDQIVEIAQKAEYNVPSK